MKSDAVELAQTWRTTHGDMTDEEWELIADFVSPYWSPGSMGRPVKVDRRRVVDAIFYVVATGCQWHALPNSYPNWNTVHRYHLEWSKDGTWERIAERFAAVRQKDGRQAHHRQASVRAASTVSKKTPQLERPNVRTVPNLANGRLSSLNPATTHGATAGSNDEARQDHHFGHLLDHREGCWTLARRAR
jgi:transposase